MLQVVLKLPAYLGICASLLIVMILACTERDFLRKIQMNGLENEFEKKKKRSRIRVFANI